jgi:DnaJ family protein C protein 9
MPSNQGSLYDLLGVSKDASQEEIKKAYRNLAIQCHPDKCKDADAQTKFQRLLDIYAVLGDAEKRKIYDETGSMSDDLELSSTDFDKLKAFFRHQYKAVTEDEIDAFSMAYRGSEEEKQDVLLWWGQSNGDVDTVFRNVMLSDPEKDSHRFADMIEAAIASGNAKKSKTFASWAKNVRKTPRPNDEPKPKDKIAATATAGPSSSAAAAAGSSSALVNPKRAKEMSTLFDALEQKYASKGKKSKKQAEPSEEEFLAIQQKMDEGRKNKSKK